MHTKTPLSFHLGLLSVLALGGCQPTAETPLNPRCESTYPADLQLPVDPDTTLMYATLTDHSVASHVARFQSAELAAVQANAAGGLAGREFALIHCNNEENPSIDELGKAEATIELATWLAEEVGVPAIVGPAASGRVEETFLASGTAGALLVSPSASSPKLTPLDGETSTLQNPGLLWRTVHPDNLEGVAAAWDMVTNVDPEFHRAAAPQTVAVIYSDEPYGQGIASSFTASFAAEGGTSTSFPFWEGDAEAISDALAAASAGSFDEVFFVSYLDTDVWSFLDAAGSLPALENVPLFLSDAGSTAGSNPTTAEAAAALERVRGLAFTKPSGPVYETFSADYASRYAQNVDGLGFAANAYDASWLVMYGHAWAISNGDIEGVDIARGLRNTSSGTPAEVGPSGYDRIKDEFAAGRGVELMGASGPLNYGADGELAARLHVYRVDGTGERLVIMPGVPTFF